MPKVVEPSTANVGLEPLPKLVSVIAPQELGAKVAKMEQTKIDLKKGCIVSGFVRFDEKTGTHV